jgi:hypothetical protein
VRPRRAAATLAALAVLGAAAGVAYGAFAATTSNPASNISAKRIYPAERSTSAWKIDDVSGGGGGSNGSGDVAFADAKIFTTGNWSSSFSTSRYVDFDYNAPLAAGLPVTVPKFNFRVLGNAGGETVCYYLEVRTLSTNTVQATYGSSGAPVDCETGNTYGTVSTAIPILANTDLGNDLRIRVYATNSASHPAKIDMATVSGAIYGVPFTLYHTSYTDSSTGTPGAAVIWPLNATDGTAYTSLGNWTTAFSSSRYLRFYVPAYVPASATITSVSLDYTYKSNTSGDTSCWYAEIYNNTTLIGTHGSSGSPVSCNSTTSYRADSVTLPEVDTTGEANNLVVKVFMSVTGNRKSLTDRFRVRMTYSLGPTGCVDSGVHTYQASGDSWIQQDGGGATTNFGTDTLLDVKANASKNRRALFVFTLPTLPTDCSLTGATFRAYLSTTGGTRTMNLFQISSSWTETGVTWNTQPTTTGSAVAATTGAAATWTSWTVTSIVQAQYAGSNYGFMVKDSAEDTGNIAQSYMSRENTNAPELQLTFG